MVPGSSAVSVLDRVVTLEGAIPATALLANATAWPASTAVPARKLHSPRAASATVRPPDYPRVVRRDRAGYVDLCPGRELREVHGHRQRVVGLPCGGHPGDPHPDRRRRGWWRRRHWPRDHSGRRRRRRRGSHFRGPRHRPCPWDERQLRDRPRRRGRDRRRLWRQPRHRGRGWVWDHVHRPRRHRLQHRRRWPWPARPRDQRDSSLRRRLRMRRHQRHQFRHRRRRTGLRVGRERLRPLWAPPSVAAAADRPRPPSAASEDSHVPHRARASTPSTPRRRPRQAASERCPPSPAAAAQAAEVVPPEGQPRPAPPESVAPSSSGSGERHDRRNHSRQRHPDRGRSHRAPRRVLHHRGHPSRLRDPRGRLDRRGPLPPVRRPLPLRSCRSACSSSTDRRRSPATPTTGASRSSAIAPASSRARWSPRPPRSPVRRGARTGTGTSTTRRST